LGVKRKENQKGKPTKGGERDAEVRVSGGNHGALPIINNMFKRGGGWRPGDWT